MQFVPLYICPALKTMTFGAPVRFRANADIREERGRICGSLMDAITEIAVALPEHIVVPYPNVSKRFYPKNTPLEVISHEEKTG